MKTYTMELTLVHRVTIEADGPNEAVEQAWELANHLQYETLSVTLTGND